MEPSDRTKTLNHHGAGVTGRGWFFGLLLVFVFTGCSPPRVAIHRDPLTPEEHLNLGVAYERNGEFDHAIREYTVALKTLPLANLYLGNAYFLKNDLKAAEDCYRKAIEKVPQHADAYNNLAWVYYVQGRNLDEAEGLARRAIALNPQKEDLYGDTLKKIRELKKR